MLREVGKHARDSLMELLLKHNSSMPRTMLRYTIKQCPDAEWKVLLKRG